MQMAQHPVFGLLHIPPDGVRGEIAVLICPPFGWDDICSYRSRRDWAMDLATSGHPTLRIDLPGAGDSGGSPEDPGRLSAWTEAVSSAASWLRTTTGCSEMAAIGIGLGGLVICRAIAEGAPIDDLVLWAVPSRGRSFVRELRTFGRMEAAKFGVPHDGGQASLPPGGIEAGGFVLSGETTRDLESSTWGASVCRRSDSQGISAGARRHQRRQAPAPAPAGDGRGRDGGSRSGLWRDDGRATGGASSQGGVCTRGVLARRCLAGQCRPSRHVPGARSAQAVTAVATTCPGPRYGPSPLTAFASGRRRSRSSSRSG